MAKSRSDQARTFRWHCALTRLGVSDGDPNPHYVLFCDGGGSTQDDAQSSSLVTREVKLSLKARSYFKQLSCALTAVITEVVSCKPPVKTRIN